MQFTLRNIPPEHAGEPATCRDLRDVVGTWVADPEVDEALADQRRIDPELWS